jgi:hypothetical protein
VVLTERPAAVDQDPQHRELLVVDHRPKPDHPGGDQRDGVGVGAEPTAAEDVLLGVHHLDRC